MTDVPQLSDALVAILVDPLDKGPLWYFDGRSILYNPRMKRVYEIRDSIPVLLANAARDISDEEASRLDEALDEAVETGRQ